jgi:uncharacterized protein (TIGR02646 family)
MIYYPKSQPAPPCLANEKAKTNGTYNCNGVIEQLRTDFKNKCYICEDKEPHSINIEHFIPHKGNKDLMFDWNNLFYCCSHCNNTKLAKPKFDSILNCTIEADEVETSMKYHLDPFPKEKVKITPLKPDISVKNTVDLLLEIYNGTTNQKKIESANLRNKLLVEIRKFQDLLFDFYDDTFTSDEQDKIKNEIVRHLRAPSNFTSFKRWIIRENEEISKDFSGFIQS